MYVCLFVIAPARHVFVQEFLLECVFGCLPSARREGCAVVSIGWGPWDGGMVTPALAAHFKSMGVPLVPLGAAW